MGAILPFPDSFASDIAEEYHQELLERGNLNRAKQVPFTSRWTEDGYIARIVHYSCTRCGSLTQGPAQLFKREIDQQGSRKQTAVTSSRISAGKPLPCMIERVAEKTDCCALCLPSLGFKES